MYYIIEFYNPIVQNWTRSLYADQFYSTITDALTAIEKIHSEQTYRLIPLTKGTPIELKKKTTWTIA